MNIIKIALITIVFFLSLLISGCQWFSKERAAVLETVNTAAENLGYQIEKTKISAEEKVRRLQEAVEQVEKASEQVKKATEEVKKAKDALQELGN